MNIAYLGPKSSFTHLAARSAFFQSVCIPYPTIPACIQAVEDQQITAAVVPIENTIEGTVNLTLDYLFHETTAPIVAELVLPIAQHLMVHPVHAKQWRKVEKVCSHPHALAQCESFLQEQLPQVEKEAMSSTASAAKFISEHEQLLLAAIAPREAVKEYGLELVAENIQGVGRNQTRFLVLSHERLDFEESIEREKLSISIVLPDNVPGALYRVLATFGWRQIDLCKIESRPLKTILGEYFFLIDVYIDQQEQLIQHALEEIQLLGGVVKILGRYPVYQLARENDSIK